MKLKIKNLKLNIEEFNQVNKKDKYFKKKDLMRILKNCIRIDYLFSHHLELKISIHKILNNPVQNVY